jgi:hypothetical protein
VRTKVLSASGQRSAWGGAISGDNAVQIQLPALVSRAPFFLEFQVYRPSGITKLWAVIYPSSFRLGFNSLNFHSGPTYWATAC